MKNPDKKPLRIVTCNDDGSPRTDYKFERGVVGPVLVQLAVAESNLVKAGKDSALHHFIALVKEIERIYGFRFVISPDDDSTP